MKRTRSAVTAVAFSNRTPFAPFSDAGCGTTDVEFSVHARAVEHIKAHQLHLRGIRETHQRANQRDRSHHQFFMSSNTSIVRP